jgi:hypothetical protein
MLLDAPGAWLNGLLPRRSEATGDPVFGPEFTESALQRARRTYGEAVHSLRFVLWVVICEAAFGGGAVYVSNVHNHSAWAQAVIAVGAAVGAAVVAFGSAFLGIWLTSPSRQRDEARRELFERENRRTIILSDRARFDEIAEVAKEAAAILTTLASASQGFVRAGTGIEDFIQTVVEWERRGADALLDAGADGAQIAFFEEEQDVDFYGVSGDLADQVRQLMDVVKLRRTRLLQVADQLRAPAGYSLPRY